MIQHNVRKQGPVLDSLMNDVTIRDATVLAIQEPHARKIQGRLLTTPMGHQEWVKMVPTICREGRWAIRSMLWINKHAEAEQVPIHSPDLTAAIVRLAERTILVASVYVPVTDVQALKDTCEELRRTMETVRGSAGEAVELAIMGDFNRHDQLWGGDEIQLEQQGEADPIVDLMNEYGLASLLPRGKKTWSDGENSTTIDLDLATGELRDTIIKCRTLKIEHRSDHRSIETVFDIAGSSPTHQDRLLFKNA